VIATLLEWLNAPALRVFGAPLSMAECLGFATGILCVWLAAARSIWNFPVGIANSALLLLLFLGARMFADSALQIMFIALGLRGWWQWSQHRHRPVRPISMATTFELQAAFIASPILTAALFAMLWYAKGSVPFFDALITALSVVAQWLLNRKVVQSWYWWIAVDVVSIPVYAYKGLYLIALLYGVFLCICVAGLMSWRSTAVDARAYKAAAVA
jgi:nicotinamide mononucleotide transporter